MFELINVRKDCKSFI